MAWRLVFTIQNIKIQLKYKYLNDFVVFDNQLFPD